MLRVTIELLPYGGTNGKRTLETILIANDGTGGIAEGNYDVASIGERGERRGRVENHMRDEHVTVLLAKAIDALNKA